MVWRSLVLAAVAVFLAALQAMAQQQPPEQPRDRPREQPREQPRPFDRRIVGGTPTEIGNHPWQVAITIPVDGRDVLCGGSIIGARWVLTAAHCLTPNPRGTDVRAKAGATFYRKEGEWVGIEQFAVHEGYKADTSENDIALIKLAAGSAGQIIALAPTSTTITAGEMLEVTGWGRTDEEGATSAGLLKASVPYVETAVCNEPQSYNGDVKAGMLCAGFRDGGIDSCQGDSGGPLVRHGGAGPTLVGVVSFSEGCARKLKYGVYTRVSAYRDWIGSTMARLGN